MLWCGVDVCVRCRELQSFAECCKALQCGVLCGLVRCGLHVCAAVYCSVLQGASQCVLQCEVDVCVCVAVCCRVWQCDSVWRAMHSGEVRSVCVCCSVLQCVAVYRRARCSTCCSVRLTCVYGAVCCSMLQCVAVCCSVLCFVAWRGEFCVRVLQRIVVYGRTCAVRVAVCG